MDFLKADAWLQFGADYWPYLLGLAIVLVTLLNMRGWLKERSEKSEA
jgi:hypothetical protein